MPKRKASSKSTANFAALWLDEAKSGTSLLELFQNHGTEKKLKAREKLITVGKKVESIYLVLEGSLTIKRDRTGEQVATIGVGSLAGELSFLTGSMPTVTAEADGATKVADLKVAALQKLLEDEPSRAGLLYACLARELAHKVGAMNTAIKAHTHASGARSAAADTALLAAAGGAASETSMDVAALRTRFGLAEINPAPELLGTAPCVCSVERHSVSGGEGQPSQLYLFTTHVCVQQGAFGLTHRFSIDLADVLAVLRSGGGDEAASKAKPAAVVAKGVKKAKGGKATAVVAATPAPESNVCVEVQCRSLSLTLTGMAPALVEPLCVALEAARLDALDNSALRHGASDEGNAANGGGSKAWVSTSSAASSDRKQAGSGKKRGKASAGSAAAAPHSSSVSDTVVAPELQELMRHTDDSIESVKASPRWKLAGGPISEEQWGQLLSAAEHTRLARGDVVLAEGSESRSLYTLVTGALLVEEAVEGLTRAVVVGRLHPGDLFGEHTLLLGGVAGASVVADSDDALVLRLSSERLTTLFSEDPSLCAKLFCLLSCEQASRLQRLTAEESANPELVLPKGTAAPDHVSSLVANDAFLTIFQKWIHSVSSSAAAAAPAADDAKPPAAKKAKKGAAAAGSKAEGANGRGGESKLAWRHMVDFLISVRAMRGEADPAALKASAERIHELYLASKAERRLTCLDASTEKAIDATLAAAAKGGANKGASAAAKGGKKAAKGGGKADSASAGGGSSVLRKAYDGAVETVTNALHKSAFPGFLSSSHYSYVMNLKLKETLTPSMDQFRALRVLGEGGFGQVLEVVKRDCGQRYAMKVQRKAELAADLANDPMGWEAIVKLERDIQVRLHHPLLVNLAYAFQTPCHLVLVMDACSGGDLGQFAIDEDGTGSNPRLAPHQVRFVAMEVASVLGFLHSKFVLYRDLKPENLLLDSSGHVRMIDFGLALLGTDSMPTSTECAGTSFYMAPEVSFGGDARYGPPPPYAQGADWWTFGVLLYELTEMNLPFGDDPIFRNFDDEWRPMEAPGALGPENANLRDLILSLLKWDADERLGANGTKEVLAHPYFGPEVEWDLVGERRLPSPLVDLLKAGDGGAALDAEKRQRKEEKLAAAKATAVATATWIARAEAMESAQAADGAAAKGQASKRSTGRGGSANPVPDAKGAAVESAKWTRTRTGRATASMGRKKAKAAVAAAAAAAATGGTRLAPLRGAGKVDGWDFTSVHAISAEYTSTQAVTLV